MSTKRRRPTLAETANAITILEEALVSLRLFCDPENTEVDVHPRVREDSKLYLESWVDTPLDQALSMLRRSGC